MQGIRFTLKHSFVASLSAGRPSLTFGYVPTKKGALQMTTASRLSPKSGLPRVSISCLRLRMPTAAHWSTTTTTCAQDFIAMKQK
eukprot:4602281-Pyramimonas_sp.AAC.1